jgi:hypothetical protein
MKRFVLLLLIALVGSTPSRTVPALLSTCTRTGIRMADGHSRPQRL